MMAARWSIADVRQVLDLGCGKGHWGFALGTVLSSDAEVLGLDRESGWVAEAREAAEGHGLADRYRYEVGSAEDLPFAESCFDMVTCQTLLMHVADPARVLGEMIRVLRPGGLLVAVEPNNLVQAVIRSTPQDLESPEQIAAHVLFQLRCERGKRALGEGDNSIGDLLPGLVADAGLVDLQVATNDRAFWCVPPYDDPDQATYLAMQRDHISRRIWAWPREQAARYFEAGGGDPDAFNDLWESVHARGDRALAAIDAATYHTGGGLVAYLVSGRKPMVAKGSV